MYAGIVIAYRDMGVRERARSLARVVAHYARLNLPITTSSDWPADRPFSRARAINQGVRSQFAHHLTEDDVILQVDPDSLISHHAARQAITLAGMRDGLVVAFDRHWYLNKEMTPGALLDLDEGTFHPDNWARPEYCDDHGDTGVGNAVAFSRRTWLAVGGFDERFGVWGGDDGAFHYSSRALFGETRRVTGSNMIHLWHPRLPQSEPGHPEYRAQWRLVERYRDADPDGIRTLIREH